MRFSTKHRRLPSLSLCIALGLSTGALGLASACSSDSGKSERADEVPEGPTGKIQLALTARGNSGALYRLREAIFDVQRIGDGNDGGVIIIDPPFPVPEPFPVPVDEPSRAPAPAPEAGPSFFDDEPQSDSGFGGSAGMAGSATGGAPGFDDVIIGVAGGGSLSPPPGIVAPPFFEDDFFFTTLFSENDPLSSTLEATLPTGEFEIFLLDGWFLEKVVDGESTPVEARLIGSPFQVFDIEANDETAVVYRFETNGEVIEFGEGRLVVRIEVEERESEGPNARRGVIENGALGLIDFTLRDALDAALANSLASGTGATAVDAYHAIIDSYAPAASGRNPDGPHCDDELTDGAPSLNGFPITCGRREADQFDNLDAWFPLAAVNRLDLAPEDGANCGQQRLIFANNQPIGNGRMFMIVEAVIPNPEPDCGVSACRPVAEFWSSLVEVDDPFERSARLADAFLFQGVGEIGPFMNADNLGPNGGQIRTNNFNDSIWTLREFHFQPGPDVLPAPAGVAEAPNGQLWNDRVPLPQGPACRESFLAAMDGLLGDNLAAMSFPVAEQCQDAESRNDFSQDYEFNLSSGTGEFIEQVAERAAPAGIGPFEVAARARFAGSCMGCHIEAGGSSLGNGLVAPFQNDFVHVNEFFQVDCGDGTPCFELSPALQDVFLPHRLDVQRQFLDAPGSCGGQGGGTTPGGGSGGAAGGGTPPGEPSDDPGFPVGEPTPIGSGGGPAPLRIEPRLTLGGQLAVPHGH